jgi:HAD superfamily hydrolase (TIGR01490 family)
MNLAVFDLDHTLLAGDSDYLWGQFLVERGMVDGARYEQANQRFYEQYHAGTLDIVEFAHFSLAPLAAADPGHLLELRARFTRERIAPIVAPGAPALLAQHRARGATLLITTATNRFVTEPIAALLGVDHLLATEPERIEGRYTGRLAGPDAANFREAKVRRLRAWMEQQPKAYSNISCYSDSHNDLPLLRFAQEPVAVDPDPTLRAEAERRGWSIISLRKPAEV